VAALVREGEEARVMAALEAYRGEGRMLVLGLGEGFRWKAT
jgi:homoserine kinase